MGPYFVQVGAFHPNPIIFICIISSDFVQVVAFILILLEWHIHNLCFPFLHQIGNWSLRLKTNFSPFISPFLPGSLTSAFRLSHFQSSLPTMYYALFVQVSLFYFVCHMYHGPLLCTSRGLAFLPFYYYMNSIIWLSTSQIIYFVCHVLQALTLYKSGPYILTFYFYMLSTIWLGTSQIIYLCMSCITGPYFVQVGALHLTL